MSLDYVHHNLSNGRVCVRHGGQNGGARRVTLSADSVLIADAVPNVSAKQWTRSRTASASGGAKRSVHADIRGVVIASDVMPKRGRRITYNPNRFESGCIPTFTYSDDGQEWKGSARILVTGGYAYEVQS